MNAKRNEIFKYAVIAITAAILGIGTAKFLPLLIPNISPSAVEAGDFRAYFTSPSVKVVVYGTAWCQYCKKTRAYFKEHNIEFADYDVEKSKVAADQYLALGGKSFPLVIIGNKKIAGYSTPVFDMAIKQMN